MLSLAVGFPVNSYARDSDMLIIAHRGASGDRPEHTLAAYERAIDQGADYIELDLVATSDLALVSRHENELSGTTNVSSIEEFEGRRRDKIIDGQRMAGWFAEDFTLAELRQLRAKERIPSIRPANTRFNDLYQVPTLEDVVKLLRAKEAESGRRIGLYIELKHPNYLLQEAGIDMVDLLLRDLRKLGITADDPVYLQCFEVGTLQRLNQRSDFKLVQLMAEEGGPADEPGIYYGDMLSPSGLTEVAKYADAVGPDMQLLFGPEGIPLGLVEDAHAAGLQVHAWTLRKENAFLPPVLRKGEGEGGTGDVLGMVALLDMQGVDGVFTDDPGLVKQALGQLGASR
ncbi:glycerophosphodiester phosphodiesterase [Erythrobacteraceae bacterium E2-1 Yellow Sea]|nr:glycerophosphodiester phosphodiesterase [Erythrobacteraceae bacterium E2-1 Yellow Sea]